eukprot:1182047-Prorocentrum_minimum.AAC.1
MSRKRILYSGQRPRTERAAWLEYGNYRIGNEYGWEYRPRFASHESGDSGANRRSQTCSDNRPRLTSQTTGSSDQQAQSELGNALESKIQSHPRVVAVTRYVDSHQGSFRTRQMVCLENYEARSLVEAPPDRYSRTGPLCAPSTPPLQLLYTLSTPP